MEIFLVGGAIRDQLLNYPFVEKDWVVVGASPEQMIELGFRAVGKDFPVFLHPTTNEEYALARTERKTAPGYKGFAFHTDPSVTLEEDLKRRDLTINAIAQNESGELIDPYGGQEDLNNKQLRHVSLAFAEDPVRILRIARFMSRYHHLGFKIAETTLILMREMTAKGETKHLVAERVWQECHKALGERDPYYFFTSLNECGALADIFPELTELTLNKCLKSLNAIAKKTESAEPRFAAICYSLDTRTIEELCQRLAIPNQFRDLALLIHKHAVDVQAAYRLDALSIATLLQNLDANRKPERFQTILHGSVWLSNENDKDSLLTFWQAALEAFKQVNPQTLIAQGYNKAALGNAIFQERIHQLEKFLNNGLGNMTKEYD